MQECSGSQKKETKKVGNSIPGQYVTQTGDV